MINFIFNNKKRTTDHHYGWNWVCQVIEQKFHDSTSKIDFSSIIDADLINKRLIYPTPWVGICHFAPYKMESWPGESVEEGFVDSKFAYMFFYKCKLLFVFTEELKIYVQHKLSEIGLNIPVVCMKLPKPVHNEHLFSFSSFQKRINKQIILVGCQNRKLTDFYRFTPPDKWKKYWTPGAYYNSASEIIDRQSSNSSSPLTNQHKASVELALLPNSTGEYIGIFQDSIIFLDYYSLAASTTLVECIMQNTPVVIRKLPPVVEYLGEDYPLFFNEIEEVYDLLSDEKIYEAHLHLTRMNKSQFSIEAFLKVFEREIKKVQADF